MLADSGTVGDVDADAPPEGGGTPTTVEAQMVSTLQRGMADVTPSLTLFYDLIFEQQVSCVDTRLGEEPADLVTDTPSVPNYSSLKWMHLELKYI